MTLPPGLQAVRERADKATAGPRTVGISKERDWPLFRLKDMLFKDMVEPQATADFIEHARTDVPALLDLIETLAGALGKYTERLPCEYNDRDYCQTHGCERPCTVEVNRAALDKYRSFGDSAT